MNAKSGNFIHIFRFQTGAVTVLLDDKIGFVNPLSQNPPATIHSTTAVKYQSNQGKQHLLIKLGENNVEWREKDLALVLQISPFCHCVSAPR